MCDSNNARQRILDIAEQLFHEQGYRAISMRDIARAAGIKQASLYYHFPDGKEQLFVEMAERGFTRHQGGLRAMMQQVEPNLQTQLWAASGWFASQPPVNLLSMMHADMPALSDPHRQRVLAAANQAIFQPLRNAFETAQARGEIRPVNPDLLTGAFIAMTDGFAQASQTRVTDMPQQVMAEAMISVLLDGLKVGGQESGVRN